MEMSSEKMTFSIEIPSEKMTFSLEMSLENTYYFFHDLWQILNFRKHPKIYFIPERFVPS